MKILQIQIVNHKKISALTLELKGENAVLAGEPGQGKTTAVSVLWELLQAVGDPIKHGEKDAVIRIVLGDGVQTVHAERKFTEKKSVLSITGQDGTKITAKEFGQWISDLAINPHKIMDMKPLERTEALLSAAEFSGEGKTRLLTIDKEIESASQDRLAAHRDLERAKQRVGTKPEEVKAVILAELTKALSDAQRLNSEIELNEKQIQIVRDEAVYLEKKLLTVKAELAQREDFLNKYEKQDPTALSTELEEAEARNKRAQLFEAWKAQSADLSKFETEHAGADKEVKELQAEKKAILESAKWPVKGITIDDGKIIYDGIPLDQAGTSKKMMICGAIAASTIGKSKIRVVRMDGIESMSRADFKALEKVFDAHDIQVLATRVVRDPEVEEGEILIVDGGVDNLTF